MSNMEAQALREHPELIHLVTLREHGWQFASPQWENGCPVELHGCRRYRSATDVIRIRQSNDVVALRITTGHPPTTLWEYSGSLAEVIVKLLALPDPDIPAARGRGNASHSNSP
jgi:hypothetical protein